MAVEFVKGWHLANVLGEGTYGEVRLLVNIETNECVAAKVIDLNKYPNARNQIKKEILIHRMLKHENIIKFFGQRTDENIEYIFLEYASGGELFDRIEPDVGMDLCSGHRFFVQIISGVEYLHSKGICHRDLKPENLLLDENDNIKISDFGMSTLFRHSGNERLLNQKCGTVPYMAPEIFIHKEYKAEPADIWSCGVILVTLLSGELPWDTPTSNCLAYRDWKEAKIIGTVPWSKIDNLVLSLVRKILMPNVSKRYTLAQIKGHQWFKKKFQNCENQSTRSPTTTPLKTKRQCITTADCNERMPSASQPINVSPNPQMSTTLTQTLQNMCFSQPTGVENMFLSTQMNSTPFGSSQNTVYQRLVKRMTRFFTNKDSKTTSKKLKSLFEKLNYNYKTGGSGQLTISTIDKRGNPLVFSASVIQMNSNQILVDFRLTKGDGIEFKRHFVNIRNELINIIVKGPTTWPLAFATHSLP